MTRNVLCCLMVSAVAAVPQPGRAQQPVDPEERIELSTAIQMALDRSPSLAQSQASYESAATGRRTAWGSFLPQVSFGSGASLASQDRFDQNTQTVVTGSSDSYSAGLSASYSLFEGGRRFDELARSGAELDAAEARRTDQRYAVTRETTSLYLDALRQEELLTVQESRVGRAQESLTTIRRRVQLGEATRSDSLRARLELANARQAELEVGTQLRAARFALGRQVGRTGPVAPSPLERVDPTPLALSDEEIYFAAEAESPAVAAAAADLEAAIASVGFARSAYLPSLSLSSGYTWSNDAPAFGGGRTSWSMRLNANYPLFNGFTRESSVDRAQQQARVVRLQNDDARLRARENADAALHSLRTAELAAEIAAEAVVVAEEDLRVVSERYRVGVATILDLITSQVALEEAEADRVSARYDYLLARAELEALLGREL